MYRAKVVAEEGRKLRPNQTTPTIQKHTHMMKRTLGCPALRTGTVGYQLSLHTHTQQHHLDYYNSTPYMYIHIFGCNKIWSFCRADLQGCFYSTLRGHRPHTYMYMYIAQHVGRQLPLGGPTCFVHCTNTWMSRIPNKIVLIGFGGSCTCTRDMMEYQLLADCRIPLWNGKGLYGTSHHVLDTLIPYSRICTMERHGTV